MKASELIERLQKIPADARVFLYQKSVDSKVEFLSSLQDLELVVGGNEDVIILSAEM